MPNTAQKTLVFEDLTIGEIIAVLSDGDSHGLCEKWVEFLLLGKRIKEAWTQMSVADLETFRAEFDLDLVVDEDIPEELIKAVKPFIKEDHQTDLQCMLNDYLERDWLKPVTTQKSEDEFGKFKTAVFKRMEYVLEKYDVKLIHAEGSKATKPAAKQKQKKKITVK